MAEFGGLAVKRLLLFRTTTKGATSGIPAQLARHHLSTQAESIKPELPFYRKPWKVFVAVLLERKPVTSKDHTELEQKFDTYQKSLEFEQSSLSSHEVRKIKLAKGSKSTKKKTTEAEEQKRLECEQELSKMEDEEEEVSEELKSLQLGSKITDEGEYSPKRLLDTSLHLVVKHGDKWLLPEAEIVEGESLRQAAERLISPDNALFLSNAPAGVCTEKISSSKREESEVQGRKVFYYKAILQTERNEYPEFGADSKWLTLIEMQKMLPVEHFKQIVRFAL